MKQLFAIIAILLVFSAQVAFAREQTTKVKCEKPASEYLKEAEVLYEESFNSRDNSLVYTNLYATRATAAALLYQICSELGKNTSPHSNYSAPSDHAIPSPSAPRKLEQQFERKCLFGPCLGL